MQRPLASPTSGRHPYEGGGHDSGRPAGRIATGRSAPFRISIGFDCQRSSRGRASARPHPRNNGPTAPSPKNAPRARRETPRFSQRATWLCPPPHLDRRHENGPGESLQPISGDSSHCADGREGVPCPAPPPPLLPPGQPPPPPLSLSGARTTGCSAGPPLPPLAGARPGLRSLKQWRRPSLAGLLSPKPLPPPPPLLLTPRPELCRFGEPNVRKVCVTSGLGGCSALVELADEMSAVPPCSQAARNADKQGHLRHARGHPQTGWARTMGDKGQKSITLASRER